MTTTHTDPQLTELAELAVKIDAADSALTEAITARNKRIAALVQRGVSYADIATHAKITRQRAQRIIAQAGAARDGTQQPGHPQRVQLSWLETVARKIDLLEENLKGLYDLRNALIIESANGGTRQAVLAQVANVGRPRITRILNEQR